MREAPSLPEREGGGFAVPAFADSLSPDSMNDGARRTVGGSRRNKRGGPYVG